MFLRAESGLHPLSTTNQFGNLAYMGTDVKVVKIADDLSMHSGSYLKTRRCLISNT